jgi:hypothetical protein
MTAGFLPPSMEQVDADVARAIRFIRESAK